MARIEHWCSGFAVGIALLLLASPPARGQGLEHGIVQGVIHDSIGTPVFGARALLQEEPGGAQRVATTNRAGRFEFWLLPEGEYTLLVEALGFVPRHVSGIRVEPGAPLELPFVLREGAAEGVDSVRLAAALLAGGGPELSVPLPSPARSAYPEGERGFSEGARFSSLADEDLQMQGLPGRMSGVRVNGGRVGEIQDPASVPGSLRTPHLPASLFERAELTATNPDVEWSGHAGGSLDGHARRGGSELSAEAFGSWSAAALRFGAPSDAPPYESSQAGLVVSGPVIPDTASFLLGFEAWRLATPIERAYPAGLPSEEAVVAARELFGVDLTTDRARQSQRNSVSGYGRFDWRPRETSALGVQGYLSVLSSAEAGIGGPPAIEAPRPFDGRSLGAQLAFTSLVGESLAQEFRLQFDASRRDYETADPAGVSAATRVVAGGLQLGPEVGSGGSYGRSSIRASEALYLYRPRHRLKLGVSARLDGFDRTTAPWAEVAFGSVEEFADGEGLLVQSTGGTASGSYRVTGLALFAQESWSPASGLDVLLGVRAEGEVLPQAEIRPNEEWRALTGLDNADVTPSWMRLSPRFGISWDVQNQHRWLVHGSVGVYSGETEAEYLDELLTHTGAISIRRGFGAVGSWPELGDGGAIPVAGPALTLLDRDFSAPRTLRGHFGISRSIGASTALGVSALYRRTDLLARAADLNLVQPVWTDQFGRPVHGRLLQEGGLLFAEPGSNRRFPSFDRVQAINQDGWSEYRGLTLTLEHRGAPLSWFVRYTASETTDNWLGAAAGAARAEVVPSLPLGEEWVEGVSELDVPHRLVAAAETSLPFLRGATIAAFYRFRSGYPFTPGFREGADLNGDGSSRNDPAFVDPELPGMESLLSEWSCLRESSGRFAERNGCRTEAVQSLDARLRFALASFGRYSARITLDGLNLLGSSAVYPDRALLLVDPSAPLGRDEAGRKIQIPLLANEQFGEARFRLQPGRQLRVGLHIEY